MNKWSKVNTFEDKPRSVWPSFFKCVRNVTEKAVSICRRNNFTRQKGKKNSTSQYQSFYNGMKIYDQQRLESFEEKKAKHVHGVRRIWKLYSKGRTLANSRDVNPSETIWIIVDEKTYKDPAPRSLD